MATKEGGQEQELGKHRGQGEDVAARVDALTDDLLGGHVAELAAHLSGAGLGQAERRCGDTEIGEFDVACTGEQDVRGADVAVHDVQALALFVAKVVREVERLGGLSDDVERHVQWNTTLRCSGVEQAVHRGALDQLHGEEERAVGLAEVEHLHDVRVRDAHSQLRLRHEQLHELRVARELRQDALECHALLEASRALTRGDEHLGHAPGRQAPFDDVGADAGGCGHAPTVNRQGVRLQGERHPSAWLCMLDAPR